MGSEQPRFLNINKIGGIDVADCDLHLRSFSGYEEISRLFIFTLRLDCPNDKVPQLTADNVLGSRIVFSVDQGSPRFFSGIVSEFALGNVDSEGRRDCQIKVVPELWKLTQMLSTRRFAGKTVAELAAQVFEEAQLDMDVEDRIDTATSMHPPRSNPIQYDETPLNFLARHFAEESIFYYFRENYSLSEGSVSGNQMLVMGDASNDYHKVTADLGEGEKPLELLYQPTGNVYSERTVSDWLRQFNFRPASWSVSDYDFHKSQDFNMTKSAGDDSPFKKFKKAAGFYDKDYRDTLLNNHMSKEETEREYVRARSSCPYLFPGARFTLAGHAADEENGDYVITSIQHSAVDYGETDIDRFEYENTFTCVPADRVAVTCPHGTSETPAGSVPATSMAGAGASMDFRSSVGAAAISEAPVTDPVGSGSGNVCEPVAVAETAFVCDRSGDYTGGNLGTIVTDSQGYGRVLIRYPWEDGSEWQASHEGCESSWRWVRTTQLSAGKQWGMKFLPRVGEEVLVVYTDGDIKRPMVVGSVYNSDYHHEGDSNTTMEEVKVQQNYNGGGWSSASSPKVSMFGVAVSPGTHPLANGKKDSPRDCPQLSDDEVSGFRTRTNSPGGDPQGVAGNQLLFRDKSGEEEIYIHAEDELNINVMGDMNISVGGDKKEYIAGDYYRVVQCGNTSSNGPVNRSVTEALTFDLDATWGYTTFKLGSGSIHPVTVVVEEYLDTETRTHGDAKSEHLGTTSDYFLGNQFSCSVAGIESIFLGGQFELSAGLLDIFIGCAVEMYFKEGIEIGYNISLKCTREDALGYAKETMNLEDSDAKIEKRLTSLEKTKVNMKDYDADLRKIKSRLTDVKTDLRQTKLDMIKTDLEIIDATLALFKGMMLFT